MKEYPKVGIISCSGEDLGEGTISRLAVRRVLDELRPDKVVTICLPLFLAGNEQERGFAQSVPTITIDGCTKTCARIGTERHSGPVACGLVVTDILGANTGLNGTKSTRRLSVKDKEAVNKVAGRIVSEIDRILAAQRSGEQIDKPAAENYTISVVRGGGGCPCQNWMLRGIVELPRDISAEMPAMSKLIEGCAYNPKTNIMSFRVQGMGVILEPRKITVNVIKDEAEARKVIDWVRGIQDITSKG
ncbi:MAG: putative zinc-binding protein [Dehalococcoidales bacterium]|nr:putative zinc-binding protein [Dehalococcoidales bacterium]